jgi:hypothetical protein
MKNNQNNNKAKQEAEPEEPDIYTPMSVFYRGFKTLRIRKCNSFRPATETQAIIEAQRLRQRNKPR